MDPTSPVQPGTELAGKYRIERVLSQGGMGVVVQAVHLKLDECVAIKFLLPQITENPDAVARFEREARASARIRSEHSVRVRDVGTLEWGAPYMVMEYLDGHDLSVELIRRGRLQLQEALDYVLQACEAIAEAHAMGIVHRDLKPANLFLSHRADGSICVKVLDFGISKFSTENGSRSAPDFGMTQAATLLGSPYYMSPEQISCARDTDCRTDIWALGVILFEAVTGNHPFEADTMSGLTAAIATQAPQTGPVAGAQVPAAIMDVVMSCLEKDREHRIQTVAELALKLRPFAPISAHLSIDRILRIRDGGVMISSYPPLGTATDQTPPPGTAPDQMPPPGTQTHRTYWGFSKTGTNPKRKRIWAIGVMTSLGVLVATTLALRGHKPADSVPLDGSARTPSVTATVSVAAEPQPSVVPIATPTVLETPKLETSNAPSSGAATPQQSRSKQIRIPASATSQNPNPQSAPVIRVPETPPIKQTRPKTSSGLGGRL